MIKRSTTYQTIVGAPPSNNRQQILKVSESNILYLSAHTAGWKHMDYMCSGYQ